MARTEKQYRALKKKLNKFHKFSFNLTKKPLSSQQKSAITKLWKKHGDSIKKVESGEWSFIKKKKGVGLDHIPAIDKMNQGIFYNQPGA